MKAVTSVVIGLIAFSLIMIAVLLPVPASGDRAGAVVKVTTGSGHGSSVHIGNGYLLTAAHVVKGQEKVTLHLDNGVATGASVLWTNEAHDVALLHTGRADLMQSSMLTCRDALPGQTIKASGNPYDLEFISMWGHVAGASREAGPWAAVLVMDMTVAPGMSGGPVYDASGNVIGLTVGLMAARVRGMDMTFVPVAYAVPSSVVCHLMGRE